MPRFADLGLLAVTCIVSLGASELALWTLAPVDTSERVEFQQSLPGLQPTVVYERDALGLRSVPRPGREGRETRRVLCLGGSTTEQVTQSFGDTWCGILGHKLDSLRTQEGGVVPVESVIFGRGGYRSVDVLDWASRNLDAVAPDVVVLLLGVNDMVWNGGPGYAYDGLESAIAESRIRWQEDLSLGGRCRQVSQLCRRLALAKRKVAQRRASTGGRTVEWHSDSLPSLRDRYREMPVVAELEREPDPIEEFGDAIDALVRLITGKSIELVVLGQPVLWREDLPDQEQAALWFTPATPSGQVRATPERLASEMRRFNQLQADIAARHGATYLDLDGRIPQTLEFFFDDCHFTDVGSRVVAEEVLPAVSAVLGWSRTAASEEPAR